MRLTPIDKNNRDYDVWDNDFFDNWFNFPASKFGKNMQRMKTDSIETKDDYIIKIDIPGYNKEDIKVHVGDNYLTVFVKKEESKTETDNEGKYVHRERYLGTSSRSFYIGNAKEEHLKANYDNGTLTISIQKNNIKEEDSPKYLKID